MTDTSPLRLGLAGLGTVGASLVRIIQEKQSALTDRSGRPLSIVGWSARSKNKDRGVDLSSYSWFEDPVALAQSPEIDVFVELMGGDEGPAKEAVIAALTAGKSVVTANKALLAAHGGMLAKCAEENNSAIWYEAAVAGGIPVIKSLREALAGNEVERVYGILNGTCNYILTRMDAENKPFDEILSDAQELGYAEADPSFDIDGDDTCHKLSILSSLAFGTEISPSETFCEGIREIRLVDIKAAKQLGYAIKLLGVAVRKDDGIEQRVHPTMVPINSPIARVDGVLNAVTFDTDALGQLMLVGPGAGGEATASAVVSDICDIARGDVLPTLGVPVSSIEPYVKAPIQAHKGGYYIRMEVIDRPGGFASIATHMANAGISLSSIMQKPDLIEGNGRHEGEPQPVVLITYDTTEAAVKTALQAIAEDGAAVGEPQCIRIEKL